MGAILGAMIGGHIVGALLFVSVARLIATVSEARKQLTGVDGQSPRRFALLMLSQSIFHSAPWLILATGFFSYHVAGESWAPWFFGGFALVVVLLGIVVIHAARKSPKPVEPKNAA